MTSFSDLTTTAASTDPGIGLRAVVALRRLLERLEYLQVRRAREHGWSWQDIAGVLGVSRQAVHKKYGSLVNIPTTEKQTGNPSNHSTHDPRRD